LVLGHTGDKLQIVYGFIDKLVNELNTWINIRQRAALNKTNIMICSPPIYGGLK